MDIVSETHDKDHIADMALDNLSHSASLDIEFILSIENLVLRNLLITQGYHELSEGLRVFLGEDNASWCTFATHASKTAGYSIRHEILPENLARVFLSFRLYRAVMRFLRRYLTDAAEREHRLDPITGILARISLSISQGNTMVFAELAPAYSRLIEQFSKDIVPDESRLQDFLSDFRPGTSEAGGQDACVQAFSAYYQARFEPDPKRKAELIYLANLLIGLHEQTRLQPVIAGSLHAPVDEVLDTRIPLYVTPLGGWANRLIHLAIMWVSRRIFATIATQVAMSIYTPAGKLRLSADVPSPFQEKEFPPDLENLQSPQIMALLSRFDRSRDTLVGSRAVNWADLHDRMNYIVDLFRSHQQNRLLYTQPFTQAQTEALLAGLIPEGKL